MKSLKNLCHVRENLILRSKIIKEIRNFFASRDYLEVDTPVRIPAPAPEEHIDAQSSGNWFLQTSPELCMKRLLAEGYPRIYQICKVFRQKERGRRHLPEFSLLEWYVQGASYLNIMQQTEEMIRYVAQTLGCRDSILYQNQKVDLRPPWLKISLKEAFETFASVSMETALNENRFDEIMIFDIEPKLPEQKPVFLYDYPACRAALARLKPENPNLAERFELYIGGLELCNGFTELKDPVEQRERFERELHHRLISGKPVYPMPEKFLESLKDMPPAAGNAMGIDRLVMLFSDAKSIDEVVTFTPEQL
ncbi:MAG: EF-P lysine aminoacylase GenX [Deltaproteobacteria bacterium]|nr:EF-P lysine aminoacylase GenX [Deltaproteobacteria bacterium]MBW1995180.1 EF-P lysine aminoacylase GenX [Deltaproteobacteria bacterium]MBW2150177.1 EF-P lysine aminoacylase GenX [Deltaproteobacteria bacterium]